MNIPRIYLPLLFLSSVRYLQYYFLSLFIAIFLAFNQEVHNILNRIVEIPPYDALQILSAIIFPLYYWKIYEARAFNLVVEIAFLFKKFHECGYRSPARLRLIVKRNYISNRERSAFPRSSSLLLLFLLMASYLSFVSGLIKLDDLVTQK